MQKCRERVVSRSLEDFIEDSRIIRELRSSRNSTILVIGGADTGKTTLVELVAGLLARETRVAVVDLDMGQSHIGLPTTIAWGRLTREFRDWSSIPVEDFYFTGALTPVGSLLPSVVGAKVISDRARVSCGKTVIDTTGLIAEPAGRVLKQFKIDLLSPDIVLALERSKELNHIIDNFRLFRTPRVYRLRVPPGVGVKDIAQRTRHRLQRFTSYFAGAGTREIVLEKVGVRFTGGPPGFVSAELRDRIVSFRDEKNRDVALGKIEKMYRKDRVLIIRTPAEEGLKFSSVVIGSTKI